MPKTPEGNYWCGSCTTPGPRTIYQTEGRSGFNPYGLSGRGSIEQLPPIVSLSEWREVVKLCRSVSKSKLLFEDGFKTLPLPKCRNPLEDRPEKDNWTPLENYLKGSDKSSQISNVRNLFEG
jgi:hypothetical protein